MKAIPEILIVSYALNVTRINIYLITPAKTVQLFVQNAQITLIVFNVLTMQN
jgi:hypothetical protein